VPIVRQKQASLWASFFSNPYPSVFFHPEVSTFNFLSISDEANLDVELSSVVTCNMRTNEWEDNWLFRSDVVDVVVVRDYVVVAVLVAAVVDEIVVFALILIVVDVVGVI